MPYIPILIAVIIVAFSIAIYFQNKHYKKTLLEMQRLEIELEVVMDEKLAIELYKNKQQVIQP